MGVIHEGGYTYTGHIFGWSIFVVIFRKNVPDPGRLKFINSVYSVVDQLLRSAFLEKHGAAAEYFLSTQEGF